MYDRKWVTCTRLVVVATGYGLAAAGWLRGVEQVRKRVTAAATIPAGVCNSAARARHRPQPLGASLQLQASVCQLIPRIAAPAALHVRGYTGLDRCPPWLPALPGARVCCIGAYGPVRNKWPFWRVCMDAAILPAGT